MDFFLNMGLAGSLMWIFYLLVKLIGKNRLSPCWSYIMLKCVLIYYLIPIPYIKWIYRYLWKHFFAEVHWYRMPSTQMNMDCCSLPTKFILPHR